MRKLMNDDLINIFCLGNKIFINMSLCEINKLDVVFYICFLFFKCLIEGKDLITFVDELIVFVEDFFFY